MHTRTGDPIFESIDPDLFFTRYLTHLCAPVFIFLAGLSAWLYAHPAEGQYRSPPALSCSSAALVIILIELVLYYLVWADSFPSFLFLQVLWAIGLCMIGLSLACRLNYWLLGALGLLIVFGLQHPGAYRLRTRRARACAVDHTSRPQRTWAGRRVDDQVCRIPRCRGLGSFFSAISLAPCMRKSFSTAEKTQGTNRHWGQGALRSACSLLRGFNHLWGDAALVSARDGS